MNIRPTAGLRRNCCALLLLVWFCALTCGLPLSAQIAADDYSDEEIRAALLLNFVRKTEWPKVAGEASARPLTIGVVGSPKVAASLRKLISASPAPGLPGQPAGGGNNQGGGSDGSAKLPLKVVELRPGDDPATCLVVYFSQNDKESKALLARVAKTPVLTVGEGKEFTTGGGIFGFERIKRKIRYWFSREAMGQSGLKISPEVIRLELKQEGARGAE